MAATKEFNNSFIIQNDAFKLMVLSPSSIKANIKLKGIKYAVVVHLIGETYKFSSTS